MISGEVVSIGKKVGLAEVGFGILRTNTVVLPYTDAGVGGTEINTDSFWHSDSGLGWGRDGERRDVGRFGACGEFDIGLYRFTYDTDRLIDLLEGRGMH